MSGWIDGVLAFVEANRQWAFWIAFVFALGENMAVISIVIPSTAILLGVGGLVATGQLSLFPIWAGASIGAVIGSTVSYWLGWKYGDRILRIWPLRDRPELVEKGSVAFRRWGALTIMIGHFLGPLRAVVFVMAGIARMNVMTFTVVNVVGCLLWAYVTPAFGEVAGHAIGWVWRQLSGG